MTRTRGFKRMNKNDDKNDIEKKRRWMRMISINKTKSRKALAYQNFIWDALHNYRFRGVLLKKDGLSSFWRAQLVRSFLEKVCFARPACHPRHHQKSKNLSALTLRCLTPIISTTNLHNKSNSAIQRSNIT